MMTRYFVVMLCMAFLGPIVFAQASEKQPDIKGWDVWQTFKLAEAQIHTIAQKLSGPFFSHFSGRTIATLTKPLLRTSLKPLSTTFVSHYEAASRVTLVPTPILTPALPIQSVYISHYDALAFFPLSVPQLVK